jgi:putative hemolysin
MLPGELANKRNMKFEMRIGSVISGKKLSKYPGISEKLDYLRKRTYNLANRDHMGKKDQLNQNKTALDIAQAVQHDNLITEYKKIPLAQILYTQKNQTVFYASAYQIPNFIKEIGRLREITFREVNEGTGQALDLDHYDDYYLHLIAWDEQENKIIGAYRMGLSDLILQDFGKKGLYTYSLFKMKSAYFKQLQPAIELGRSFIVREYQKQFNSLFLLWRGIGEFIARNNRYRYLFGPVSISSAYNTSSKKLLLDYLQKYHKNERLAYKVKPRNFRKKSFKKSQRFQNTAEQFPELEDLILDIENNKNGVPILIRQYLKLGAEFIAFNIDPLFSNVIDGLIVIDLCKSDEKTLGRYMGAGVVEDYYMYHQKREKLLKKAAKNKFQKVESNSFFQQSTG